ncbi:MAG: hypothetical protein ACD_15C00003G0005 [uncultured bacterium]|nr:MAG: hypothetical protein ACD_15C00003G0005 [uncultured bacterium]HCU70682.1 hypothetical protein [Candidatus Moranbacteria bacterium]
MPNKKLIATLIILLVVVFTAAVYLGLRKNEYASQEIVEKKRLFMDEFFPKTACNFPNDEEAEKKALENEKIDFCNCISDKQHIESCRKEVMDTAFYNNAQEQLDETLCEKIENKEIKNECNNAVMISLKEMSNGNLQGLANNYDAAHNEKAISIYENLIQKDKAGIENHISLARMYAEKGLKEQEKGGNQSMYVQKAFKTIEKAKAIDKDNSEVYRVEGYINEIKPDLVQARLMYEKAIELDPKNVFAYIGRGHVNRMFGILDVAAEDFNRAAKLDANKQYVHIYANMCNIEMTRGNNEEAVKNCKTVTDKNGVDPVIKSEACQTLARILLINNDIVQARNYLMKAQSLAPNDPNLYVGLATLSGYEGNFLEEEKNAKKAIELSPTKAMGYLALSFAFRDQEKYKEAITEAQKGIEKVSQDVSLLAPYKAGIESRLNGSIAAAYGEMGDTAKQNEYEKKAEEALIKNNK